LENIVDKLSKLKENLKIKLFFVEKDNINFTYLKKNISEFFKKYPFIKNKIQVKCYNEDCNNAINKIILEINDTNKNPLFVFIDPTGLQIKKTTMQKIVELENPKDIIFNYILEGVRRTSGIAKKQHHGAELNIKEVKVVNTLKEFIGENINIIGNSDIDVLKSYCSFFTLKDLNVVVYDVKYPNRDDIICYLRQKIETYRIL